MHQITTHGDRKRDPRVRRHFFMLAITRAETEQDGTVRARVMTACEAFSSNQRKLSGGTRLTEADQHRSVAAPDGSGLQARDILNIGGFNDFVFNVINAFIADNQRIVAEVEAIEL